MISVARGVSGELYIQDAVSKAHGGRCERGAAGGRCAL